MPNELELDPNATESTKNICCVKGESKTVDSEAVQHAIKQHWRVSGNLSDRIVPHVTKIL